MTAGWCSRALRAAVFAAVCVLLASLGHVMMSGTAVPWWAMALGTLVTGGAAWRLAGRERGPALVGSVVVAAQVVLHSSFSLAQAVVQPESSGGNSLVRRWLDLLLCSSPSGAGPRPEHATTSPSLDSMGSMGSMDHMGAAGLLHHGMQHGMSSGTSSGMNHGVGGLSSTGMLAAHLLAALLCGLWLAHGERAAFRILRTLAGWAVVPLRLVLRLPTPPHRPRLRVRRGHAERVLRQLLLTHSLTSRGPPAGTAVA